MFHLGPDYGIHDENNRYTYLFWQSIHRSVYLSVRNPRMFFPASHYCFCTNRNATEVTREEIDAITIAMRVARHAFLNRFTVIRLSSSDSDLRSALGRSDRSFPHWVWRETREIAQAVREAVTRGDSIFVPTPDDLRVCVKSIQEDRRKPQAITAQSERFKSTAGGCECPRRSMSHRACQKLHRLQTPSRSNIRRTCQTVTCGTLQRRRISGNREAGTRIPAAVKCGSMVLTAGP